MLDMLCINGEGFLVNVSFFKETCRKNLYSSQVSFILAEFWLVISRIPLLIKSLLASM